MQNVQNVKAKGGKELKKILRYQKLTNIDIREKFVRHVWATDLQSQIFLQKKLS